MNVKIFASGELAYDNQLPEENGYAMRSIRIQEGVNKGGTAMLVLPPNHKKYNCFTAMRTLVEIYRDGKLRWRGRPLPHSDDFYGNRTITCEGELCFLNDSTMRPYALKGKPRYILSKLMDAHNLAVDSWKQFHVGTVTVSSDTEVELSNTSPEQVYAVLQKLINLCGGYIFFDSNEAGRRQINWYADMPYICKQPVRFGENLLDYSSSASVTGLATRIVPFGARDENGNRIRISNVPGSDFVSNKDAQAQRGIIEKAVIYDDISDPIALRVAAEKDVLTCGTIPETIRLSALDMSRFDVSIDSFAVGQIVTAKSDPHKLAGQYALVSLEEDLVQPGIGSVTLTKDVRYYDGSGGTLSGSLSSSLTQQEAKMLSGLEDAVKRATAWLTNGKGYKVERVDVNGNTVDTLYMDTPDINTAVNVLRIGQSGIGFSRNGVNGPYVYAWTIDGNFNTEFLRSSVITSADGSVQIDLANNKVIVATQDSGYKGKIELSSAGINGYGWDSDKNDYVHSLRISPGRQGNGSVKLSSISSMQSNGGLSIAASKSGAALRLGVSGTAVEILGNIKIGGKSVSWKSNSDGSYILIGKS